MSTDEEMAKELWREIHDHVSGLIRFNETFDSSRINKKEAEAAIAAENRRRGMCADQNTNSTGFEVPRILVPDLGDGLGQDAQMRRSMTMPTSFSTLRICYGLSCGHRHHPEYEVSPVWVCGLRFSKLELANHLRGDGLGQDAQMWRSMTNTSFCTLRTHGLSNGHHHHPGYAAATTASSGVNGVNRVLNPLTTAGDGTGTGGHSLGNFTAAPGLQRPTDCDLEAGGGGAAPTQQPSEVDERHKDLPGQVFASLLPGCAMSYSALKDAPNHVKLIIFGGLVVMIFVLFYGMLSRSSARRQLGVRLVSCSAVTLLTFSVASQLSGPTYIAITAVVGVLSSLVIMLLRF